MSSVDTTVRTVLQSAPDRYSNRTDVLHNALCVIGNGYSWVNGEAVSSEEFPPYSVEKHRKLIASQFTISDNEELQDLMKDIVDGIVAKVDTQAQEVLPNLEERVHLEGTLRNLMSADVEADIYPQTDICLLMNIPDDVTADWREACDEMIAFASARGWKF